MSCNPDPPSAYQSTYLNNRIQSFNDLGMRIVRNLGAPNVTVEITDSQMHDCISQACEFFTKYAGVTRETLIFDSSLYERDRGVRLDTLFTIGTPGRQKDDLVRRAMYIQDETRKYVSTVDIPASDLSANTYLSGALSGGIFKGQVIECRPYFRPNVEKLQSSTLPDGTYMLQTVGFLNTVSLYNDDFIATVGLTSPTVSSWVATSGTSAAPSDPFVVSKPETLSVNGMPLVTPQEQRNGLFDYDVMDYRKVTSVYNYEKGSYNTFGVPFTIESSLAQQTYFQFMMGGFGFDMLSFYSMKSWLETRERILGLKQQYEFNERTQYLKLYPQPRPEVRNYGIIECWVEKPLRDIIKEPWVQKYAQALVMRSIGWSRSKFSGMTMFGGGSVSNDMLSVANQEIEKLETELKQGVGAADSEPMLFFMG